MNILDTKHRFDKPPAEEAAMGTLAAKVARHAFVAARLDTDGRIVEACQHRHGRTYANAIACARTHGWDGFAEVLETDDAPLRPLDVWRFDQRGGDAPLPVASLLATSS